MGAFAAIMYVLAVICFGLASFGATWPRGVNLIALGLVFFALPVTVAAIDAVL